MIIYSTDAVLYSPMKVRTCFKLMMICYIDSSQQFSN